MMTRVQEAVFEQEYARYAHITSVEYLRDHVWLGAARSEQGKAARHAAEAGRLLTGLIYDTR